MRPARLDQSIRNAMSAGPGPEAFPHPPTQPPTQSAPASKGGALRRMVKAPAALLRAFFIGPAIARSDALAVQLAAVAQHLQDLTHQVQAMAAATQTRGSEVQRLLEDQRLRIDTVWSSLGGRFDEMEIKVRPLLPLDDRTWGVRLGDGYVLIPRDQPGLLSMAADATSGGFEPGTRRVLKALIQPGMRVADIGANVGLLSLACARATGPTGEVIAFEPETAYRDLVTRTLALNGMSWARVDGRAVGRSNTRASFHVSTIPGHSSLYALPPEETPTDAPPTVEVVRLDDALGGDLKLDVVKIDVEGAELDVLAGMEGVLAASPDLAIVAEYGPAHLARVGITPEAWLDAFTSKGFTAFAIAEPTGSCKPAALRELARVVSVNLVFVRPNSRAARRLPR